MRNSAIINTELIFMGGYLATIFHLVIGLISFAEYVAYGQFIHGAKSTRGDGAFVSLA